MEGATWDVCALEAVPFRLEVETGCCLTSGDETRAGAESADWPSCFPRQSRRAQAGSPLAEVTSAALGSMAVGSVSGSSPSSVVGFSSSEIMPHPFPHRRRLRCHSQCQHQCQRQCQCRFISSLPCPLVPCICIRIEPQERRSRPSRLSPFASWAQSAPCPTQQH